MQASSADSRPGPTDRRAVLRYSLAVVCAAAAVILSLGLQTHVDVEVPLLLGVMATAWFAGFRPALLAGALVSAALLYGFTPPMHVLAVQPDVEPDRHLRMLFFAVVAVSIAAVTAGRRRAEQREIAERRRGERALQERADLLNLTHDTIFTRDMRDVITFWNRGAEERYGWTGAEALGRISHDLLRTKFPMPLEEITAELTRLGRWEGELVHMRRDGSKVVVASRWALQRNDRGEPVAVLETNNDITARKQSEQALEDLAGRLIHAQEAERSRIGRELHDHISQLLGVLSIQIDQLHAHPEITPAAAGALAELRRGASEVTEDVHRLSHRLHSSTLDYLGLIPALQKLVGDFSARLGIAIELVPVSLPSLPSDVALCLFRVTEESLTNIAKHSQARSVRVQVSAAADGISLIVDDDGVGFDVKRLTRRTGLGFVSMQERLRLLRGTIRVDSAPSRGTSINAWVPAASLLQSVPAAAEQG